jgi:type VI protein secretion system component VasK
MRKALRLLLVILGLVAFALAVWFGGPLIGIAGVFILAGVWSRVIVIGVV